MSQYYNIPQMCNEEILSFTGDYFFLSNYSPYGFIAENENYFPTSEHYYHFRKADVSVKENRPILEEIMKTKDPHNAKKLGRALTMRKDWDAFRHIIMFVGNKYKFDQNPDIRNKLIKLNNCVLIEGNTWNDTYWGVNISNGEGHNYLGKTLMELRDYYISKYNKSIDL